MNAASGSTVGHRARKHSRPVRLLPSVITILALSSGLSAIKFALDGETDIALLLIGGAAIFDALDGRVARLLDATSKMGAELDSLSDAISFGVAPGLILYSLLLDGNRFGWIIALIYTVSIVLRLARFNTLMDDANQPSYTKDYFVGVPAPAGALMTLVPVVAFAQWGQGWWTNFPLVAVWTLFSAALIVSRVPTLAMKSINVPPRLAVILLVLVVIAAGALVTYPRILLLILVGIYLVHIPFAIRSQRYVAARPEIWDRKPAERRAIRRSSPSRGASRLGLRRPSGPSKANHSARRR